PEYDNTPDPGELCFVTGNAPYTNQFNDDVDGGKTTLLSPVYDLSPYGNAFVRYHRWYTNDTGGAPGDDRWIVDVSADSGITWVRLETDSLSDRSWRLVEHNLLRSIPMTAGVRFRFVANEDIPGSVVEAGVDDFSIITYQGSGSGIDPIHPDRISSVDLEQNVPNPFNPETTIRFSVPEPGMMTTLKIYDVAGRAVTTLIDRQMVAGTRTVRWNGKDSRGNDVSSGVYFYRLEAGTETRSRKLVLLR
ncbi:MAG: T9SS type A sorting domain-containing protein, partial [Candidatus Latescibacterota bacterium]